MTALDPTPWVNVAATLEGRPIVHLGVQTRNAYTRLSVDQALDVACSLIRAATYGTHVELTFLDPGAADELALQLEAM